MGFETNNFALILWDSDFFIRFQYFHFHGFSNGGGEDGTRGEAASPELNGRRRRQNTPPATAAPATLSQIGR